PKSPTSESSTSESLELSSFSLKIFDENFGHCSTQQPNGMDKAKSKRKNSVESSDAIETKEQENRQLGEMLKENNSFRQKIYQMQMVRAQIESRKLALAEYREQNKILLADLNSIADPKVRNKCKLCKKDLNNKVKDLNNKVKNQNILLINSSIISEFYLCTQEQNFTSSYPLNVMMYCKKWNLNILSRRKAY
ncbi:hypothetical protein F8388_008597, partial [Cannabis sativa]